MFPSEYGHVYEEDDQGDSAESSNITPYTPFLFFTHMELRSSSLRLKTAADDVSSCRSFTCFTYQQLFYKTSDVVTEEVFYTVTGTQGECVMALRMFITNPSLILLVIDNLLISAKLQYVLHHHACLHCPDTRLHIFVQLPGSCVGGKH